MDLQELLKLYHLLSWVRKKCSLFQTTASWGLGRAGEVGVARTISVLMVEALNLGSGNSGITKLRLAWVVMRLNASPLHLLFQGPTWTPLTKGCPWSTCSILELGNCKKLWKDERLEGSQVRPGIFPVAPSTCTFYKTFTSVTMLLVPWRQAQEPTFTRCCTSSHPKTVISTKFRALTVSTVNGARLIHSIFGTMARSGPKSKSASHASR